MLLIILTTALAELRVDRFSVGEEILAHCYIYVQGLGGEYNVQLPAPANEAFWRFSAFKNATNLANLDITVKIARLSTNESVNGAVFLVYFQDIDNLLSGCEIKLIYKGSGGALDFGIADVWGRSSVTIRNCKFELILSAAIAPFCAGAVHSRVRRLNVTESNISLDVTGARGVAGSLVGLARDASITVSHCNLSLVMAYTDDAPYSLLEDSSEIRLKRTAGCIAAVAIDSRFELADGYCRSAYTGDAELAGELVGLVSGSSLERWKFLTLPLFDESRQFTEIGRISWSVLQCEEENGRLYCW